MFTAANKLTSETFLQFVNRLKINLGYYIKSREVGTNFDKLLNLLIVDKLKDTLKGPLREQVRVVENNAPKDFSIIAEFLDNYVSETQDLTGENEALVFSKPAWQKPAGKTQNLSATAKEFASLPINARLQSMAAGTAPEVQGATVWPPCRFCKHEKPNHSPDNCRRRPGAPEGHNCPICKKENQFHTPNNC